MADTHHPHPVHARNPDARAAFLGLVVGALVVLLLVFTVVKLTSRHYAGEKPGAEAPRGG